MISRKDAKGAKTGMDENQVGRAVVDTAISIHRDLGPGLLESVYEVVLASALSE